MRNCTSLGRKVYRRWSSCSQKR